jgi:hypothetical protein
MQARLSRLPGAATPQNNAAAQPMKSSSMQAERMSLTGSARISRIVLRFFWAAMIWKLQIDDWVLLSGFSEKGERFGLLRTLIMCLFALGRSTAVRAKKSSPSVQFRNEASLVIHAAVVKHESRRSIWTFPGAVKHNRRAIFLSPFLDNDGPVQHFDGALHIQDHGLGMIVRPGLPQIAVQANAIFLIYCI